MIKLRKNSGLVCSLALGPAALSLLGCAAEVPKVGSSTEALTCNASSWSITMAQERTYAAACAIRDQTSGTMHYIDVGGLDANTKMPTNTIKDSTNGTAFTTLMATIVAARWNHRSIVITDSNGKDWCVVLGGNTANEASPQTHTPSKKVDVISVNGGAFTVGAVTDMQIARELPEVSTCGGQITVFGGLDVNGKGIKHVERASNVVPDNTTMWTNQANKMSYAAGNFSLVKIPGADKYVASGGTNATPAIQNNIWALDGTSSCTNLTAIDVTSAPTPDIFLSHVVEGHVGFYVSSGTGTDTVKFATGRKSTAAGNNELDTTDVTVNWSTPSSSTVSVAANATQGHYRGNLVSSVIAGTTKYAVVNGADSDDSTASRDVDEFTIGGAWAAACTTSVAHRGPSSWLVGSDIFTIGDAQTAIDKTTP
jgi:hypothetical protein